MESFFCIVYAETEDGYIYSEPVRFSVAEYAEYIFQNHEKYQSVLPILISMLDYGTAAMNYCGTEADVFPNELVPDELRVEFDTKELSDAAKSSVESKKNQDIAIKGQIITPIGAYKIAADLHECLSLRLSLTLGGDIEGTVTLYYWNANDVIAQNDGKVLLDPSSAHILSTAAQQNKYTALIDGIPFVAANEIFYAAFVVTDNSGTYFGPVKVFSANFYAASLAEIYPDSETAKLAKALLAYTNEAEKYIESERDR